MSAAKAGQRVRITVEGITRHGMHAPRPGGSFVINGDDTVTFEVLPDPEPEWQSGDVVVLDNGAHRVVLLRRKDRWTCDLTRCFQPSDHTDEQVTNDWRRGEVTHLVRDGKPVQP